MSDVQRKQAALIGALVGDAASLGFHWLYDPDRIRERGGKAPEFRDPDPSDFEGCDGFFAHGSKRAGDLTHYGERCLVPLRAVASAGCWNPSSVQAEFVKTFERGGRFSGYIDGATSGTLENLAAMSRETLQTAADQTTGLNEEQIRYLKNYTAKLSTTRQGNDLVTAVEAFMTMVFDSEAVGKQAALAARYFDQNRHPRSGADDNQISACSMVPVVTLLFAGKRNLAATVDEAIRITNHNDEAVTYGVYAARVLERVILGSPVQAALDDALRQSEDFHDLYEKIKTALDSSATDPKELAAAFGPACGVKSAIPLSVAILNAGLSYTESVRLNIQCSGDSAGRALFIGSILGARHGIGGPDGVPLHWMARLHRLAEITADLARM